MSFGSHCLPANFKDSFDNCLGLFSLDPVPGILNPLHTAEISAGVLHLVDRPRMLVDQPALRSSDIKERHFDLLASKDVDVPLQLWVRNDTILVQAPLEACTP